MSTADGRKKARCVLGGHRLQQGRDFERILSPTVKHTMLRTVLAVAEESDWFMTVFYEHDARYRRSCDKFIHGRIMKIYLAVMAQEAEEWEKARRMLCNTVFR
eukprot:1057748-Pleurochrysis_carterae.AAC.5